MKGRHHDGEEGKKEEDAVGSITRPNEYHIPPDIGPVRDRGWDGWTSTHSEGTEDDAVGKIERQHGIGRDDIMRGFGRVDVGTQQRQ